MQIIVCFISKYALVDLDAEDEVDLVVLEIDFVGVGIDFVDLDVAPLGFDFVAVEIDLWEYLILK